MQNLLTNVYLLYKKIEIIKHQTKSFRFIQEDISKQNVSISYRNGDDYNECEARGFQH